MQYICHGYGLLAASYEYEARSQQPSSVVSPLDTTHPVPYNSREMNVQRTAPVEGEAQGRLASAPAPDAVPRGQTWSRYASVGGVVWLAGVLGVLVIWLWVMVSFRGMPVDDPYITYRYAANIASGNGYVYNLGEHVQSTSTPDRKSTRL